MKASNVDPSITASASAASRFSLVLILISGLCAARAAETFDILIARTNNSGGLISGTISVNGACLGLTCERSALKIAAGEYKGLLRYWSDTNFVQGPFGTMGKRGDFLLEVANAKAPAGENRTDILFHGGDKPGDSPGCILLGPIDRPMGVPTASEEHPLRKLSLIFYGTDSPASTPYQLIKISIVDKPGATPRPSPPGNLRIRQ